MVKPKVEVYQPIDGAEESYKRIKDAGINVILHNDVFEGALNNQRGCEIIFDVDTVVGVGIANKTVRVTHESLQSAPNLRMIVKYTVGYDNVDIGSASNLGILVVHSPTESNWGGVAEGTLAYILTMLKKVREKDRHVKSGGWRDPSLTGTYVGARLSDGYEGLTIGIVGFGRIGARVANLLNPWHVRLLAYDPYVDESKFLNHDVRSVSLEVLLEESDVITIHCDLNEETIDLISEIEFARMKESAILINAARGAVVNTEALHEALVKKMISGAALDVLPEEPPNPELRLLELGDQILLSPHMITANDGGGLRPAIPWVEAAIHKVLRGQLPKHIVNDDAVPKWRKRFEGSALL